MPDAGAQARAFGRFRNWTCAPPRSTMSDRTPFLVLSVVHATEQQPPVRAVSAAWVRCTTARFRLLRDLPWFGEFQSLTVSGMMKQASLECVESLRPGAAKRR